MLCRLELLAFVFVALLLLNLAVNSTLATKPAVFLSLKPFRRFLFVFPRRIISTLAIGAGQRNQFTHESALK